MKLAWSAVGGRLLRDLERLVTSDHAAHAAPQPMFFDRGIVFSPGTERLGHLETKRLIANWTDATVDRMADHFANPFIAPWQPKVLNGQVFEQNALDRRNLGHLEDEFSGDHARGPRGPADSPA